MVTIDLEIKSPKIEENYTIKELKDLLYLYLESLEKEDEEIDYKLYEIDYEDLTEEQQKKVDEIRNMSFEELEKNFISI